MNVSIPLTEAPKGPVHIYFRGHWHGPYNSEESGARDIKEMDRIKCYQEICVCGHHKRAHQDTGGGFGRGTCSCGWCHGWSCKDCDSK